MDLYLIVFGAAAIFFLAYKTYEFSLVDFEKVYTHFGRDYVKTLEWFKGLEKEKDPEDGKVQPVNIALFVKIIEDARKSRGLPV